MVKLIKSNLAFILDQIKIAQSHANGTPIRGLMPDPPVQWSLRTVNAFHNNIVLGQERSGAADRVYPRLAPAQFHDAGAAAKSDRNPMVFINAPAMLMHAVIPRIYVAIAPMKRIFVRKRGPLSRGSSTTDVL